VSSFSTGFRNWESIINQEIKLVVYAIQRLAKREWQNSIIASEHRYRGPENSRLQT
jgi:hypothetical protein